MIVDVSQNYLKALHCELIHKVIRGRIVTPTT